MTELSIALFALDHERALGDAIASALGVAAASHEERVFEDGEHKARPLESVRGRDVYVLSSLHGEPARSVNDKLVRMLMFVATLKDSGAARVTAVAPYLAYGRKDQRSKPRDPVATRYVASLFEAMRVDAIVSLDVHNVAAYQNAFRCRAEHLEARPLFARHLAAALRERPVVVVSPDVGGIKRAEAMRRTLEIALGRDVGSGFVEKHRSEGRVSGGAFAGDVRGRVAVIVDDMISAGTTMARAAAACRTAGAASVIAVATHAVFAPEAGATLGGAPIDEIIVTDSIAARSDVEASFADRLRRVSIAPLLAEAIRRLAADGSLVELGDA